MALPLVRDGSSMAAGSFVKAQALNISDAVLTDENVNSSGNSNIPDSLNIVFADIKEPNVVPGAHITSLARFRRLSAFVKNSNFVSGEKIIVPSISEEYVMSLHEYVTKAGACIYLSFWLANKVAVGAAGMDFRRGAYKTRQFVDVNALVGLYDDVLHTTIDAFL